MTFFSLHKIDPDWKSEHQNRFEMQIQSNIYMDTESTIMALYPDNIETNCQWTGAEMNCVPALCGEDSGS